MHQPKDRCTNIRDDPTWDRSQIVELSLPVNRQPMIAMEFEYDLT